MKIIYSFIASLLICVSASAQCSINGSAVPNEDDVSPTAANCPHVQQNVFYDQTIQGRVLSSFDSTITFPISATFTIRVDSVRIDDVLGLPAGITWSRSPIVLPGGAAGVCVLPALPPQLRARILLQLKALPGYILQMFLSLLMVHVQQVAIYPVIHLIAIII